MVWTIKVESNRIISFTWREVYKDVNNKEKKSSVRIAGVQGKLYLYHFYWLCLLVVAMIKSTQSFWVTP